MKVDIVVCMRALDASLVAAGTDYARKCSECGFNVCVAPTSLPILAANPGLRLVCNQCIAGVLEKDDNPEVVPNPAGMAEAMRAIEEDRS